MQTAADHPIVPELAGARKMRWSGSGRGKRGGIRVIYFYVVAPGKILLLHAYAKNEKENVTDEEKRAIREAIQGFRSGLKA